MENKINKIEVVEPIITGNMEHLVDISKMTAAELKEWTKKADAKERAKEEKERIEYEKSRDVLVENVITTAKTLFNELSEFKLYCHIEMDKQAIKLSDYGKLRSNSKGGFSVSNSDDTMRLTRRRDTEPSWDERSTKAVELIKSFLGDTIKKRDLNMYEILMSFLERNAKGDLEYSRVMDLYKHEHRYDDERWKEGLKLIKESFSNHLKGFGYEFKIKGTDGKWQNLSLNFSSL
jgi:hypothetical protein